MWCKTDGEKEDRRPNGDFRTEGNSGLDGKGRWSEKVWACVEEEMMGMFWEKHWRLKWRTRGSEDDQIRHGRPCGEGEQECWFGDGCHELSKMESGSWRDCC